MSGLDPRKRRHLNRTTVAAQPSNTPISATQRVLTSPELLSLIFGFLAHTDVASSEGDWGDAEVSPFQRSECSCPCTQCLKEPARVDATAVLSLPSPFEIPLKERSRKRGDEKEANGDDLRPLSCHCQIPTQSQLTPLFAKSSKPRKTLGANRPSYNLANALVCKQWSTVALDALWRVVDRPERLFALLDGSWGTKQPPKASDTSDRLKGLRGLHRSEWGEGRMPTWWEPGVLAFLNIKDDDDSDFEGGDEGDADTSEREETPAYTIRRREYELYVSVPSFPQCHF